MNDDITAGYIISDVERLRLPMQKITNHLLKCMGATKSMPFQLQVVQGGVIG